MTSQELVAVLKKNPFSTVCAAVAIVSLGVSYYRSSAVPELESQLEERSAEGQRHNLNLKNAVQLPEQVAALEAATAAIEPRLVKASRLATNLQYFYKLEADTGVKLVELRQNATRAPQGKNAPKTLFTGVNFSVSVEGDYAAVVDFLRRLDNGTHFARVLTASVAGITVETGSNIDGRTNQGRASLTLELLGQP